MFMALFYLVRKNYPYINLVQIVSVILSGYSDAYPSNDIDTLYEQYVSSLSDLLDIHAPIKMMRLTKPAPGWITNGFRTTKCLRRQYE